MEITKLGPGRFASPIQICVDDDVRFPVAVEDRPGLENYGGVMFEKAGPRRELFFDPSATKAAIVTCGGLCPGLNNVIRSAYLQLFHGYGVKQVYGIRYGYAGLDPANGYEPLALNQNTVSDIHEHGGTILGSSRGPVDPRVAVDYLASLGVNILFTIGGDGTQKGAHALNEAARERGHALSVVGIPKTIDNDILWTWRTFGYFTALEEARRAIDSAHNEARGAYNGIGLVKLMGRESGFIAAGATLASQEVNFCLIPEVPFRLDAFLDALEARLNDRRHAVIVIAEGAAQDLMGAELNRHDASGNVLFDDCGMWLKDAIARRFKPRKFPYSLKYIDPSYIIRSRPANTDDALLCDQLARHAVHAAMSGRTDLIIGYWYNVFVHVPMHEVTRGRKKVSPNSELWHAVLAATGQPARFE